MPFQTDNEKYGGAQDAFLRERERQRKYVFQTVAQSNPCPVCSALNNHYTATGDTYSVDDPTEHVEIAGQSTIKEPDFTCHACGEPLRYVVYLFGGSGWQTYRVPGQTTQPTPEEVLAWKERYWTKRAEDYAAAHPEDRKLA